MTPEQATDLTRDALRLCLVLGLPLLGTALVLGILSGMLQTAMNIHEHSISFVPKLVAVALALCAAAPWLISTLVEFAHSLIVGVPQRL